MDKLLYIGVGIILLGILLVMELYKPARAYAHTLKMRSYITNMFVFAFNNAILFAFQITAVFVFASEYKLISFFDVMPLWTQFIIAILVLDFFIWLWHRINHQSDFLWRFHKCHHSEKYLNVTSAIRFHIGELLLSVLFKSIIIVLFGIPLWIFIIYEALITFFAMFHHANIRLPKRMQTIIGMVFITPDMHRSHHSSLRHEHDSNYGVIFSWWDKLFKTFNKKQPKEIGLKGIEEKTYGKFMVFPFRGK